ncbi:MAG: peptide chain release factor N(5)-glutamine methyltransferase [Deltaproteobacteria bacterium]|jgi:release factor glutamine methyltransferase|nr:peptide chain release factor N(5)-glutamine methyltransferase [Deltaproteobacteria bacterium]
MTENTAPTKTWLVGDLLQTTTVFLGQKGLATPRLEAELLLAEILALTRMQLYVHFDRVMTEQELEAYRGLIRRRIKREPSAYILGRREFYLLNFKVTPDTLIPRPETELLVDEAIALAKPLTEPLIWDLGCGCGAIALALAKNLPQSRVTATDLSLPALEVAKGNALVLGLSDQVEFLAGDLTHPVAGRQFNLICANLPYVPQAEIETLDPDVSQFEPRLALDGGPDGLDPFRRLLPEVSVLLKPGGYLLLEIHPPTLPDLTALIQQAQLAVQKVLVDYGKNNRVVVVKADNRQTT